MEKEYKMTEVIKAIEEASKEIKKIILKNDTDKSEQQNSTGDTQLKLDIASDIVIEKIFREIPSIKKIVSEERDEIIDLNESGNYLIAYDPLDGSSLVDVNLSVGSIYGIYENDFTGANIIASVYVVFGPRIEMVVATKDSCKLYRLIGEDFGFIKDIKLENKGEIVCTGSTQSCWYSHHKELVDSMFEDGYYLRYSGGMVPDLHQIILKGGGLFSYPGTTDKPKGKLRQLFEVFPFAFAFEAAGGGASDGKTRVLEIETTHIHDTSPCFFGSLNELKIVEQKYSKV
eukprot:Anaeramoba_flamelloidesa108257_94.p1 GENE.a108257_94~~a108257_94.p1  ORF type:complete len:287 (+),score=23.24 a108257_94:461-1321(+)